MNQTSYEKQMKVLELIGIGASLRTIGKILGMSKHTVMRIRNGYDSDDVFEDESQLRPLRAPNPSGLCRCGCGQKTTRSVHNDYARGIAKGEFNHFIKGHHHNLTRKVRPEYGKQFQRQKLREKARKNMVAAIADNPRLTMEDLQRDLAPDFDIQSISRMLNIARPFAVFYGVPKIPQIEIHRPDYSSAIQTFQFLNATSAFIPMKKQLALQKIDSFIALVSEGLEAWKKAGAILVELIDDNPDAIAAIQEKHPWITRHVLDGFERIGRNQIYPALLLDSSLGAKHLSRLPITMQQVLYGTKLKVREYEDGKFSTKEVTLQEMTKFDCYLAFASGGIRSIEDQDGILSAMNSPREGGMKDYNSVVGPRKPDRDLLEEVSDKPKTAEAALALAQASLIDARELLSKDRGTPMLNSLIEVALKSIGKIRFDLNPNPEDGKHTLSEY